MRHVGVLGEQWLALVGWHVGAFKRRVRDRWIGWLPEQQFHRLHLIANNARFLVGQSTLKDRDSRNFGLVQSFDDKPKRHLHGARIGPTPLGRLHSRGWHEIVATARTGYSARLAAMSENDGRIQIEKTTIDLNKHISTLGFTAIILISALFNFLRESNIDVLGLIVTASLFVATIVFSLISIALSFVNIKRTIEHKEKKEINTTFWLIISIICVAFGILGLYKFVFIPALGKVLFAS